MTIAQTADATITTRFSAARTPSHRNTHIGGPRVGGQCAEVVDNDPVRGPLVALRTFVVLGADEHGCERSHGRTHRADRPGHQVWWGQPWQLGSAAYWTASAATWTRAANYRRGLDLREEVVACLLGGYGVRSAVADAAWERLRKSDVLVRGVPSSQRHSHLLALLSKPLPVNGRLIRYRFARQRALRIAEALARLDAAQPPELAQPLRRWLTHLPGIGLKTASWIVRNHLGSDQVAIIDVHLTRAGVVAGVFDPAWTPARHYELMEQAFLDWAKFGEVSAAHLDAYVWHVLARTPFLGRQILGDYGNLAPVWPLADR